ncbi:MAG: hypothetical protein AAGA03_06760, partial [Planctomycetota bacterium]
VQRLAARSSLESVGWGLFFPDMLRLLSLNRDPYDDRGRVQEQLWATRMAAVEDHAKPVADQSANLFPMRQDWRLGHLAAEVSTGGLPAVIFNSFVVNTGQRVMIAPFRLRPSSLDTDADHRNVYEALEYTEAIDMQLRLATAARLSATFPYVSPTAVSDRPIGNDQDQRLTRSQIVLRQGHLCDGGITDNEGLLAALDFIQRLRDQYGAMPRSQRPFDRILLVRIVPFPTIASDSDLSLAKVTDRKRDATWLQAFLGPAIAVYNGRSIAQQERGAMDIQNRLRDDGALDGVEPLGDPNDPSDQSIRIATRTIDFRYPDQLMQRPPLSWKLSPKEKRDIEIAWQDWASSPSTTEETNLADLQKLILGLRLKVTSGDSVARR